MFNKETKEHTENRVLIYVSNIKTSSNKIKLHTIDTNYSNYDYKEFIVKMDYRFILDKTYNDKIEVTYKINKNSYKVSNYKLLDKVN